VIADIGHTVRVRYIATNPGGDSAPATSDPSGVVTMPVPTNTQLPTITDPSSPVVGVKLYSKQGRWTGNPTSFQAQWLRCDAGGSNCSPVTAYGGPTKYLPVNDDYGHTLRIRYIATNPGGDSDPAASDPTGVVSGPVPSNVRLPTINNPSNPAVGVKLTSIHGGWTGSPTSFPSQWLRCDADGTNCSAITSYSDYGKYIPVSADVGHALRIRYVATNPSGDSAPATSDPTGVVN